MSLARNNFLKVKCLCLWEQMNDFQMTEEHSKEPISLYPQVLSICEGKEPESRGDSSEEPLD